MSSGDFYISNVYRQAGKAMKKEQSTVVPSAQSTAERRLAMKIEEQNISLEKHMKSLKQDMQDIKYLLRKLLSEQKKQWERLANKTETMYCYKHNKSYTIS